MEDDHNLLGPFYHVIKLGLNAITIIKIREFGSEGFFGGVYKLMFNLYYFQKLIKPVKKVLDAGVNINIKKYANITPFYFVSRNGYLALVEYLFYRGTKISVAN